MTQGDNDRWIAALIGREPASPDLFRQALTHGSAGDGDYQRLEFLGDRVLGLVIGEWLYRHYPGEPEGQLSHRFNQIVSGDVCAEIAREIGAGSHIVLGKQARDDGASESSNVLGDVVEALIGALFLDGGFGEARALVHRLWEGRVDGIDHAPKHPKSALQEWAAAHKRKAPEYVLADRSGPAHAPQFTVTVSIRNIGDASASGTSKQEAETEAARKLLRQLP